jgi:MSHA biogenesis protein MshO
MRNARGFTLLELVVSIAISAIVLVFAGLFVKAPLDAYMASSRRTEIQDSVSVAWPRIEVDLHMALPNSVRVTASGSNKALELLPVMGQARFMSTPGAAPFNTAPYFDSLPTHKPLAPVTLPVGMFFLSANNAPPNDAYALTNVMTPANRLLTFSGDPATAEDTITISPAFSFAAGSPNHRIYLVRRPVTYLCNESAGTLQRFSGYTIAASQSSRNTAAKLTAAGAAVSLVARDITSCSFSVQPATASQGQIVTIRMTVTRDGETTSILHAAAIDRLQ